MAGESDSQHCQDKPTAHLHVRNIIQGADKEASGLVSLASRSEILHVDSVNDHLDSTGRARLLPSHGTRLGRSLALPAGASRLTKEICLGFAYQSNGSSPGR